MNRRTVLTLGSILGVIICIGAIVGWGAYKILNLPSVKESLQTTGSEFSAMLDLRQKILQNYPCDDIGVKLVNGTTLNISLINSEFVKLPSAQQSRNAQEIAVFVKNSYTGKADVREIVITFVENHQLGPIKTFRSFSYPFDVSELQEITTQAKPYILNL